MKSTLHPHGLSPPFRMSSSVSRKTDHWEALLSVIFKTAPFLSWPITALEFFLVNCCIKFGFNTLDFASLQYVRRNIGIHSKTSEGKPWLFTNCKMFSWGFMPCQVCSNKLSFFFILKTVMPRVKVWISKLWLCRRRESKFFPPICFQIYL